MGQTGRLVGQFRKKSGAVAFTARGAPIRVEAAQHPRSPTIATPASPIGRQGGVSPRRPGVARTGARAALPQQEVVLRSGSESPADGASPVGHLPAPRAEVSGPSVFA